LRKVIEETTRKEISDPRDCIDFVCIADLGTWTLARILLGTDVRGMHIPEELALGMEIEAFLTISYFGPLLGMAFIDVEPATDQPPPVDPTGRFLTYLFRRIADADPAISPLSEYFHDIGLEGLSEGIGLLWPLKKVPPEFQKDIL
jgi:hypothetical protein